MVAKKVFLDGNIYNELVEDANTRALLARAVSDRLVRVIVTPMVEDELATSPFKGVPDWFPIDREIESVAVLGHWRLGRARLGRGAVFGAHRGKSKKVPDAIIAESASELADVLVTNDHRCLKRFLKLRTKCQALDYSQFKIWLKELTEACECK